MAELIRYHECALTVSLPGPMSSVNTILNTERHRRPVGHTWRGKRLGQTTTKGLGRWESLEMVQRYTRSVSFQDSMRFYKALLL